jgi:hypothetical protein
MVTAAQALTPRNLHYTLNSAFHVSLLSRVRSVWPRRSLARLFLFINVKNLTRFNAKFCRKFWLGQSFLKFLGAWFGGLEVFAQFANLTVDFSALFCARRFVKNLTAS